MAVNFDVNELVNKVTKGKDTTASKSATIVSGTAATVKSGSGICI